MLPAMKTKTLINSILSAAMMLLYVLSLAGLDVHHCNRSGETFVVFLAKSLDCNDIHPDHHHHHHHGSEECSCNCCHDEAFMVTGASDCPKVKACHLNVNDISTFFFNWSDEVYSFEESDSETASKEPPRARSCPADGLLHKICVLRV